MLSALSWLNFNHLIPSHVWNSFGLVSFPRWPIGPKQGVDVDADVSDLRDAIGDKLHSQRIEVESLSLTLWKSIKELPNGNEAKDVPAGWIREAKGRFDDTVATELKKPQERANQIIGSGVEQANNSLVRVIVLSEFPEQMARRGRRFRGSEAAEAREYRN